MSLIHRTFSESWHLVSTLRLALRPTVTVRKQSFRGETWYLLHDPFNNSFFRSRPEAYRFVTRLRLDRTVEQVWEECLERFPDTAPGQEDVVALLAQLHHQNLLYHRGPTETAKVFDRYEKRRQREVRSRLMNLLFPRFHLFDPDPLLGRLSFLTRAITGWAGLVVWAGVVGYGVKQVIDRPDRVLEQAEGILAPDNWLPLYVAILILKTLHELGHAMLCKRFGGDVHSMGMGLIIFTPLPYMDATSSWGFRSRWQRALVGAGGMIVELFVASLAAAVWASTGEGTVHGVAYNMMWLASVSTLAFNLNPLVRFDGYYIMSDLLEIPNLQSRSQGQLIHLVEHHLFGRIDSESPATSRREAAWLTLYGVLSHAYRFVLLLAIILFISDRFLIVGLVMSVMCLVAWVLVPLWGVVTYLSSSPRLNRVRWRAALVTIGGLGSLVAALALVPVPRRFRSPGVIEAVRQLEVVTESAGYLTRILVRPGQPVVQGTPLAQLTDPELAYEIRGVQAELDEVATRIQIAKAQYVGDLGPIRKRQDVVKSRLKSLRELEESLVVTARISGTWFGVDLDRQLGAWMARGSMLGRILDEREFRFTAILSQDESSSLSHAAVRRTEVRLTGQERSNCVVSSFEVQPSERWKLPAASLGWGGGGEIAISTRDPAGLTTLEPFFAVHCRIALRSGLARPVGGTAAGAGDSIGRRGATGALAGGGHAVAFYEGRTGHVRFTLDSRPLLQQWGRRIRQLFQRRYRI